MNKTSKQLQQQLAKYCRTGQQAPPSSLPDNMKQYREMVFLVAYNHLKSALPLFYNTIGRLNFKSCVNHFLAKQKITQAQIWKLPLSFFQFYSEINFPFNHQYPFLKELLHFEWLEIEVFMMPDMEIPAYSSEGRIISDKLIANPEIKVIGLEYPIHKKPLKKITEKDKGQYFISFHRDVKSKKVKLNEISYPHFQIIDQLIAQPTTSQNLVQVFENYLPITEAKKATEKFLNFGLQHGIILGFQPKES